MAINLRTTEGGRLQYDFALVICFTRTTEGGRPYNMILRWRFVLRGRPHRVAPTRTRCQTALLCVDDFLRDINTRKDIPCRLPACIPRLTRFSANGFSRFCRVCICRSHALSKSAEYCRGLSTALKPTQKATPPSEAVRAGYFRILQAFPLRQARSLRRRDTPEQAANIRLDLHSR